VVTTATETNDVFAGVASLNVPVLQLLGPEFVTTCVYVMLLPAVTGLGVPLLVTARSQSTDTGVETVVVLFAATGSLVVVVTVELAVMVPAAMLVGTLTTTMMSASAAIAKFAVVQFTPPALPTAGVVQLQPAGAETDANVVVPGVASVKLRPVAAAGPLFVMTCVYVILFPARTDEGVATVLNTTSACVAVATTSVAVAEFAPNDWFAASTVAVSVITVPLGVNAFTL
jgi:hypothetical protein